LIDKMFPIKKEIIMPKVEIKETIGCKKKLNIEVENERFDVELKSALKKIKSEVQIPGFRKGKVPESLLLKRFGNFVREEAVKDMVPKVLNDVFEEQGIKPVGEPEITDFKFDETGPITFTVTVEEVSPIDISGFEGLKVIKVVQEVTEDDIDNYLERLQQINAEREEVDREARDGDILVVNLQKLDLSGVPIIGEKIDGHVISLDGYGTPSPEFDRQVLGMKKGDSRRVQYTYDETIRDPELFGKTEAYDVEVLQVIENKLPELNDDFAQSLGDYADLNDLREKARGKLANQYEFAAGRKLHSDLINEFIKQNPFEVPQNMVEKVIQSDFENAKKNNPDKSIDEGAYKAQIRADAVRAVQTYLIVDAIKEEKGIEVTKEELAERFDKIAESTNKSASEIRRNIIKEERFDAFKNDIAQEKVFDWIEEVANIKVETFKPKPVETNIITP